jgi:hypothetical protein
LLALDQLHLERVQQATLDESAAVDLVGNQKRYLDSLLAQRGPAVTKRVATNRPSAKRQKPMDPPLQASLKQPDTLCTHRALWH